MEILPANFCDQQLIELLLTHVTTARAQTAPESAHALDLNELQSPGISLWTAWEGKQLLGCGALKLLSPTHGEIKSMHTSASARRMGVGTAMLQHIIATAREMGLARLSLETGSWEFFAPARALYSNHGFVECPPFGDYVPDPNSVFMTLELSSLM